MNIRIDKYAITSDPLQYILNDVCVRGEKSKCPGEEYLSPIGYYPTLHGLLTALFDKKLRTSDAVTVKDLLRDISDAMNFVQETARLIIQ